MPTPDTVRTCAAILLALPLLGSGANFVFDFAAPPSGDAYVGVEVWRLLREGGLLGWAAIAHVVAGVALLVPRWRYLGALLQLPVTLGIVAFNASLYPPGLPLALGMLVLNAVVLTDRDTARRMHSAVTSHRRALTRNE